MKVYSDCDYPLLPERCLELAVPACRNSVILNLEKLYSLCFNVVLMVETLAFESFLYPYGHPSLLCT